LRAEWPGLQHQQLNLLLHTILPVKIDVHPSLLTAADLAAETLRMADQLWQLLPAELPKQLQQLYSNDKYTHTQLDKGVM
jgi:hypothetical protein